METIRHERARLAGPLLWAAVLSVLVVSAACAGGPSPRTDPARLVGATQEGLASWYGPGFHGRPTASGETYDMDGMTAAHKTLPLHTWVRVENLDNGRSLDLRVNDRGPFVDGRIVDLSRAAAESLGMLMQGIAPVRLTVLGHDERRIGRTAARVAPDCAWIQVGAFAGEDNAAELAERLDRQGAEVRTAEGDDGLTRVLIGPYEDPVEAEWVKAQVGGILRACS